MLIYNKPLEIKDKEGKILYTIKNLTLDAEYELENYGYRFQEVKENLIAGNKFVTLTKADEKNRKEYFKLIIEKTDEGLSDEEIKVIDNKAKNIMQKMIDADTQREKDGKRIMVFNDVIHNLPKSELLEMVAWVKEHIKEVEELGLYDCALEINTIYLAFYNFKEDLKKK